MDLGELSFRITASAEGVQGAIKQAQKEISSFAQAETAAGNNAGQMGKQVSKGASEARQGLDGLTNSAKGADAATVAAFAAIAAAAAKGMSAVVSAVSSGIAAYNGYVAAVKGLQSVATFKGIDTSQLEDALNRVKDQFLDTASASAALKNLLSRGYSMDQAVTTINRLKDAAAYGRQASYDMAEAVVSATEGLKNENSILVNAA